MPVGSIPALSPPPGVKSNFENPESQGVIVVAVGSVLLALTTIFLSCRLYAKFRIIRSPSADDLTCSLAAVLAAAIFASQVVAAERGPMGKHQWDVTLWQVSDPIFIVDVAFVSTVLFTPAFWAAEMTFFLLYLQLFRPLRWLRITIYVGATLMTAFYVAAYVTGLVLSTPRPEETWFTHMLSPELLRWQYLQVPLAAVGMGIDFFILILPLKAIRSLQLPRRRKLGLSLVFLTGLLACIASTLILYYRVLDNQSKDTTWLTMNVVFTGLVELYVGVIVSCMPSVSKLFQYYNPTLKAFRSSLLGRLSSTRNALLSRGSRSTSSTRWLRTSQNKTSITTTASSGIGLPIFGTTQISTVSSRTARMDCECDLAKNLQAGVETRRSGPADSRRIYVRAEISPGTLEGWV